MQTKQPIRRHIAVNNFIEEVNARMLETGITISELARRAHVTRPYIHRILSGQQVPSLTIADAIAKALGLQITTTNVA
jgi:transcriptional regulator with XRE-family HTH domain